MSRRKDKGRLAPFVPLDLEGDVIAGLAGNLFRCTMALCASQTPVELQAAQQRPALPIAARCASGKIGGNRDSISRWFRELQHYGFIVMTSAGGLSLDGKGKAPHWRLTELEAFGGHNGNTWMLPTKDFLKWDGTEISGRPRRCEAGQGKKQNPGPGNRGQGGPETGARPGPETVTEQLARKQGPYRSTKAARKQGPYLDQPLGWRVGGGSEVREETETP